MAENLFGPLTRAARWVAGVRPQHAAPAIEPAAVDPIAPAPTRTGWWHGAKYPGGMTGPNLLTTDYWALRARSAEFFSTNLYARGLLRRLVTNEINTGLQLEAKPEEAILGYPRDGLAQWSETIENRFKLWSSDPRLCDVRERLTFGELQAASRLEALIAGDVLWTLKQDQRTGLPRVKLINAAAITTPMNAPRKGNRIEHGVELDSQGRQVAYWIQQNDLTAKRLPAWGEKSGRRLAWLVYGTDKRLDDVRGEPFLSLAMQSLKEIDRYRDAVQRKAAVNALIALTIERDQPNVAGRSFANAGISRGTDTAMDASGTERDFHFTEFAPGFVADQLQAGEKLKGFTANGTDEKFGDFEDAILTPIAWGNNIPPEILKLAFTNNYSASQAAINEFKLYLNVVRTAHGVQVCRPCYLEWLLCECLSRKIDNAASILESWRSSQQYDVFGAWTANDWSGHIKPAVDFSKLVKGYELAANNGFITRDRASRELTGTKYSKNVEQLARENEQLAGANAPLVQLEKEPAPPEQSADDMDRQEQEDTMAEFSKAIVAANSRPRVA